MNKDENVVCEVTGSMPLMNEGNLVKDTTPLKISGVYGIHCKITDKWYVGQSIDIQRRFRSYKGLRCRSQPKLYNALLLYGIPNFEFVILDQCSDKLVDLENQWISFYDSINNGYNIREGGPSGKFTSESREKMRLAKIGSIVSNEVRLKISRALQGRKQSIDTCKKIGNAHRGKMVSDETKKKIQLARSKQIFKPRTQEQRERASRSQLGYKHSPEMLEKMRINRSLRPKMKHRPHTEETKQKIREKAFLRCRK